MSERSLVQATQQLPCSVVILSAKAGDKQGAMTATAMYVSQVPPLLVVSASKTFATSKLIEESKEFAISIIADSQVKLAKDFGKSHGHEVDKLKESGLATEPAAKIGAPLISGCFANIECRVKTALWDPEGNHAIYVGEVVAFKVNPELRPTVWLNNRYFRVGDECSI